MRIIFVRHGHPNYEKDCLTELGRKHAAAAAERLKDEGISEIYSSTCGRAYETAGYVAEKYGLPIVKCEFMREISWGSVDNEPLFLDGHPWSTVDDMVANGKSILKTNWASEEPFVRNKMVGDVVNIAAALDEWLKTLGYIREGLYYRVRGNAEYAGSIESIGSIEYAGSIKNVECAQKQELNNTNKTIAAFGHGGAGSAIFSHLFNLPYPFVCTTLNQDYTGITIVEFPDTPGTLVKPRFEILNDARHIRDLHITNLHNN